MLYQKNKFLKKRSLFKIFSKSGDKKKTKTNIKYNNLKKITKKVKSTNKRRKILNFFGLVIILSFIICIAFIIIKTKSKKYQNYDFDITSYNKSIEKAYSEEKVEIQNYMDIIFNGTVIDGNKIYYPSKNPKISIVIAVYNGEAYLKTALLSVQNQDFKDIEIVLVDDGSKDNSVNLIKELMKTEPRIVLYENGENKGTLFAKSKGVLLSKGKYVIVMDEDDIFVQRDAFTSLYVEAEKNDLDMLGYMFRYSGKKYTKGRDGLPPRLKKITYQPELSNNIMYIIHQDGHVTQFPHAGNLVNTLVRTDLFKKVIKLIDEENMKFHMNHHEDYILYYLMMRYARSIKYIERIFYIILLCWDKNEAKVKFRTEIKNEQSENKKCFAYLNFFDIFIKNMNKTEHDKKIVFSQMKNWYLNIFCRKNKDTREMAIRIFKKYIDNDYVLDEDKKILQDFIDNPPK